MNRLRLVINGNDKLATLIAPDDCAKFLQSVTK